MMVVLAPPQPSPPSATDDFLAGYKYFSLPNLAAVRIPRVQTEVTTVQVQQGCTDHQLLVAIAKCLGAYSASSDVLLGWRSQDDSRAVRVRWEAGSTWEATVKNISVDSSSVDDIRTSLGLDSGQEPFVALISDDLADEHPLVAQLVGNLLHVKTTTLYFHHTTTSMLTNQIAAIITQILDDPGKKLADDSFFPKSLQSVDNRYSTPLAFKHINPARTVVEYVIRYSISKPDNVAFEWFADLDEVDISNMQPTETLSYGELHTRSNQFARYLLAQGLQKEERVALCAQRDCNFHVAMFGILKAGGCYVPIDPELNPERQKFIAEDSSAKYVFTADTIGQYIVEARKYPEVDINIAEPDDLSYILYTSGTTGQPKGCLLTHRGLSQAIHSLSWYTFEALGPPMRYLTVASVAFDVHLAETFVPLAVAMTLVAAPRSQLLENLPLWLRHMRITHVGVVPSLIEATMLAVEDGVSNDTNSRPMDLRYIASGGEKMSDSILERWANHPRVKLANFYGPSEVTIGCAARFMHSNTRKESIGRIFDRCASYVVDEKLNIVMRGGLGELLVAGTLVGRGYVGRDDLTKKSFLDWEGMRAYKTGDLVRMMPDGTLEILGRIDTQIKLRGVRIESEGVSNVLRRAAATLPGLKSVDVSTILARHPLLQTDQLVSFIAWDSSVSMTRRRRDKPKILSSAPTGLFRALKQACAQELASYMRPAHMVPIEFLPLNPNGKSDNKVLLQVFLSESLETIGAAAAAEAGHHTRTKQSSEPIRALSETERLVVEIIAPLTTLPQEKFGAFSNLFEVGFDSLKLVRLASQLRTTFTLDSHDISVGRLMQDPTIEGISVFVDELSHKGKVEKAAISGRTSYVKDFAKEWSEEVQAALGDKKVEKVLPTFPVQDGVLYRSAADSLLYVQHVALKCRKDISLDTLRKAWETVLARHEILRTIFFFSRSIVQVVLAADSVALPWEDGTLESDEEGFDSWFLEVQAPKTSADINHNISSIPPFRIVHYRKGEDEYIAFSIHHSIYDGTSLPLLFHDVQAAYLEEGLTESAPLSEVLELIYATDAEEAAGFWREVFAGYEWPDISDRLEPGAQARTTSVRFRSSLSDLECAGNEARATFQSLLTSAFGVCVGHQLYGRDDIVFGVIRSGRSFADEAVNSAQCPLITVLPIRVEGSGDYVVPRVQRHIGRMLAFEHVSLSKVQQWVRIGKSLFDVVFSISFKDEIDDTIWEVLQSVQPQADYALAVEIILDRSSGDVTAYGAYNEDEIEGGLVEQILRDIEDAALALAHGERLAFESSDANGGIRLFRTPQTGQDEDSTSDDDQSDDVDPATVDKVRDAAARFLRVDPSLLSLSSSLISYGLDSIKSVGLSRVLRQDGINASAIELMKHPTIRGISRRSSRPHGQIISDVDTASMALLQSAREEIASHVNADSFRLNDADAVEVYPVTTLQAGMLSQTVHSDGRLYVHEFPFRLSRSVDRARLKQAWHQAFRSVNILRTSFHFLSDFASWVQAVHTEDDFKWDERNVSDDEDVAAQVQAFVQTIDLSSPEAFRRPPVFLRLLKRQNVEDMLIFVLHHSLYDGMSIDRLSELVHSFYWGREVCPIPQFIDFLGYFEYQSRHGTKFWVRYMDGYRPTALLRDHSKDPSYAPIVSADIPVNSDQIKAACQQHGVTVQVFGQAVWAKILASLNGSQDIAFGHVVSGRSVANAENVIGPMITTLPCRVRFTRDATNAQLVRSVQRSNMDALKWQHTSLRNVQRTVGISNLWDSIFLFQPLVEDDAQSRLWSFHDAESEVAKVQYSLNVELHQFVDRLEVKMASQAQVVDEDQLQEIALRFSELFLTLINKPDERALDALPAFVSNGLAASGNADGRANGVNGTHGSQINGVNGFHDSRDQSAGHDLEIVERLSQIVAASTKVPAERIELDTPLISLGVDSISVIQILNRLRKSGIKLGAAAILQCNTLAELSRLVQNKVGLKADGHVNGTDGATATMATPLVPAAEVSRLLQRLGATPDMIEAVGPATPGMKWLIGMWQNSGGSRYQYTFAFRLKNDECALKTIEASWRRLVQWNPILRSTFVSLDRRELRVVTFKEPCEERLWQVRTVEGDNTDHKLFLEVMKDVVSHPLSTTRPPQRAVLVRASNGPYLILHFHHLFYDAWSLELHMQSFIRFIHGEEPTAGNDLQGLLRACTPSPAQEDEQRSYWQSVFPTPFRPVLFPRLNPGGGDNLNRTIVTVTEALHDLSSLNERAQAKSLSLNTVFLACWAQVQAKYTGRSSSAFGIWSFGRSGGVDDIETLAVPCVNVFPIHVQTAHKSALDVVSIVHSQLRHRSFTIEQSYLERVEEWVSGRGQPLFNVFVNIVLNVDAAQESRDECITALDVPYTIPEINEPEEHPTIDRLAVSDLLEEGMTVDIIASPRKGTVLMSIESSGDILSEVQTREVINMWATAVHAILAS